MVLPLCDVAKVTPTEGDLWGDFWFIISCPPVHLTVRADSLADRNRWIAGLIHHSRVWREKNGQIARVATVATRGVGAVPGAGAVPPKDEETYTERSADVTQTRGARSATAPPRPPTTDEEKVSGPLAVIERSAGAVEDGSAHYDRTGSAEAAPSRRARRAAELARAPAADEDGDGRRPAAADDGKHDERRRRTSDGEQDDRRMSPHAAQEAYGDCAYMLYMPRPPASPPRRSTPASRRGARYSAGGAPRSPLDPGARDGAGGAPRSPLDPDSAESVPSPPSDSSVTPAPARRRNDRNEGSASAAGRSVSRDEYYEGTKSSCGPSATRLPYDEPKVRAGGGVGVVVGTAAHHTDEDESQDGADDPGLYGSSGRRATVRSQRRRNEHSNQKHAADAYAAGAIPADEVCTVELLSEDDDDDDDGGEGEVDGCHGFNAGTHSVLAKASRDSPEPLHESHVRAAPRVPGGPLPDLAAMLSSDEEDGVDNDYEAAVQAAEHRRQQAREASLRASHRASDDEHGSDGSRSAGTIACASACASASASPARGERGRWSAAADDRDVLHDLRGAHDGSCRQRPLGAADDHDADDIDRRSDWHGEPSDSAWEGEQRSPNEPIAPRAAGPPYIDDAYDRGAYDDDDGGERQAPHQLLDGDGDHLGGYDEYGYGDEGRPDSRADGGVKVRAEEARDRHNSGSLRADENFVDDDWDDDEDR